MEKDEMRRAYLAASGGDSNLPTLVIMPGRSLNELLGTTEFDADEVYHIMPDGIFPVADDAD